MDNIISGSLEIFGMVFSSLFFIAGLILFWIVSSLILHIKLKNTAARGLTWLVWIPFARFFVLLLAAGWGKEWLALIILATLFSWVSIIGPILIFLLGITTVIIWFRIGSIYNSTGWGIALAIASIFPFVLYIILLFFNVKNTNNLY